MTTNVKVEKVAITPNTKNLISVRSEIMEILSGPKVVTFTCRQCGTKFRTTQYTRTRKNHYSASCPCCPYSVWAA